LVFAAGHAFGRGDRGDSDRDGVPDARDRCVSTPRGAEPILKGCAVIELIARPEIFADPVRAALDTAAQGVVLEGVSEDYGRESALMRRDLEAAASQFDAAARELGQGELCAMAETTASVRNSLEGISRRSHEVLLTARTALQRRVSLDDRDADFEEVAFHELGYRASLVGDALVALRAAHSIANRACDQVKRPSRWTGIVESTDDAARIVELTGNRVFVFPAGAAMPGEGARVDIEGIQLHRGTAIAYSFAQAGDDPPVLQDVDEPFLPQCIKLQIAPFQPFHPPLPVSSNYVLHDPTGYIASGDDGPVLNLESPMRLAAAITGSCATVSSGIGKAPFRYSVRLLYKPESSNIFTEFASDLTPYDDPVELPGVALPSQLPERDGVLRVIEQRQKCIGFASINAPRSGRCTSAFSTLRTTDYDVTVRPRGAYGRFNYKDTFFNIDPTVPGDFDVAEIQSFSGHPTLVGLALAYAAEGYSATGNNVIETINFANPTFAIRADDFYDPDDPFPIASSGTDRPSGLRWPRITGTRNGAPFRYSAALPFIDRDLAELCDPGPDSFYRLPWTNNTSQTVTQGNSTTSTDSSHKVGTSQEYAFDFGLGLGVPIHAARGGTVTWLTETQTTNYNPDEPVSFFNLPFPPGSSQNWGNVVRITHQDGTTGWYMHIDTMGVVVNVGQVLSRGALIAHAGNTGRSSGPHLHFQVQAGSSSWGNTIPILFDTANKGSCYIPQTGDNLTSNNVN
jgi:murein DD-endopeptidase MepM/ murein hydrolase activator NlpD